jgi:uncharacterized lipoprotein
MRVWFFVLTGLLLTLSACSSSNQNSCPIKDYQEYTLYNRLRC